MTVIAVFASPPRPGLVGNELAATSPLSAGDAADFYEAVFRDAVAAVDRSGADLLVNYLPANEIAGADVDEGAAAAELRGIVADELGGADARFEPQVGSTFAARAGNTVTHLLREEGAASAAVVRPNAPLLGRTVVDRAAMKLRTAPVVLGPSPGGRVFYAGFTEPVDFADGWSAPAVGTLVGRADDAGLAVDFLEYAPVVETGADLADLVPLLRARAAAGRFVPPNVATFIEDCGIEVSYDDGDPELVGHTRGDTH